MDDSIYSALFLKEFKNIKLNGYKFAFSRDAGSFKRVVAFNMIKRFNDVQILCSFHLTQKSDQDENADINSGFAYEPGISILAVTASSEFRVDFLSDISGGQAELYVDRIDRTIDLLPADLSELRLSYRQGMIGLLSASLFYLDDKPAQTLLGLDN